VVGVNKFQSVSSASVPIQKIDSSTDAKRAAQVKAYRAARDQSLTDAALEKLSVAARGSENLFPFVIEAFRAAATLGEICGVLRREWGEFQPEF
jgi:methylmalonyl-CoA mutase, N-terminal domain